LVILGAPDEQKHT